MTILTRLFGSREPIVHPIAIQAAPPPLTSAPLVVSSAMLDELARPMHGRGPSPFRGLPKPPPGVRPDAVPSGMAMDDAISGGSGGAWGAWATGGMWGEGLSFLGYPYLAELAQRPEYRNIVETIAEEMTRKWIELKSTGDEDKSEPIKTIEDAIKRLGMRKAFERAAELDGYFGMGIIYLDMIGPDGTPVLDNPDELRMPLILDPNKVGRESLRGFVPVDPTWVSPMSYNSTDPLKDDFFRPSLWYIMSKPVHASRLLIFRSREVPDILKASYNFGGLPLSQMSKPYVDNWLRTRQSVSDLLHSFTTWVLKTNMQSYVQDAVAFTRRMTAFVLGRDNRGLLMIDKETEEFENISAPLGGLDKLQAQAQEQMAFPAQEPILKFVGYTPTGLGDTSEVIIRSWYDRVHAKQEKVFGYNVTTCLKIIQLSELGAIDPEITFEFVDLWELDAAGKAAIQKINADTAAVLLDASAIDNDEVRTAVANDPDSMFHGLEGAAPEPPEMDLIDENDSDASGGIAGSGARGRQTGANSGV